MRQRAANCTHFPEASWYRMRDYLCKARPKGLTNVSTRVLTRHVSYT